MQVQEQQTVDSLSAKGGQFIDIAAGRPVASCSLVR